MWRLFVCSNPRFKKKQIVLHDDKKSKSIPKALIFEVRPPGIFKGKAGVIAKASTYDMGEGYGTGSMIQETQLSTIQANSLPEVTAIDGARTNNSPSTFHILHSLIHIHTALTQKNECIDSLRGASLRPYMLN